MVGVLVCLLHEGAMLDPVRLRTALLQKGWTKLAIAGVMAGIGAAGMEQEAPEAATQ